HHTKLKGENFLQGIIGKYLSSLDPLYHTRMFKEGFEAQLRASRLSISCGMRALGMARERRHGHLQGGIQPHDVPGFQGLAKPASTVYGPPRHLACRHGHCREAWRH